MTMMPRGVQYEWLQTRTRFAALVCAYVICLALSTSVLVHYARNDETLLESGGSRAAAVIAALFNALFLVYELAKLRLGFPRHVSAWVSFFGHVTFFAASIAAIWNPDDHGMRRALR